MRPKWTPWKSKSLHELDAEDLYRLKKDEVQESYFVEYKRQWDPFKVARSIASFANTEGGTVVVGVEDHNMVPIAVEGIDFSGNLLESVDQAVRQHVTPLPTYSSALVSLSEQRICLVVEVPAGYDTPYVLVKTGQILERSNTSSHPVPPQNRERIQELFQKGKSGKSWADQVITESVIEDGRSDHLKVWTIPQVDGGLNLNAILYRPSFVREALSLAPVPFAHVGWNPTYETPGFHLAIKQVLSHRCTTEIHVDGVVFSGWSLVKDTNWVSVRPDLPEYPLETDNFFTYMELRKHVGLILTGHQAMLGDLVGYVGPTTVALKGIFESNRAVSASRSNVPTGSLNHEGFHQTILRDFDRALGQTVLDPED